MSKTLAVIIGVALLAGLVLFVASFGTGESVSMTFRGPSGDEAEFAMRHSERGGDSGFFTSIATDINDFFSDFGWYRDLSRAWFELGEPLRVLLNWIFGGIWALVFLRR
ncbi:MAG: hypothetical protein ACLFV8_02330 [Alphaproteobacteria bacterium]